MADASSLDTLMQALRRLPGVGVKSAARMAFHLMQHDRAGALQLRQQSCETFFASVRREQASEQGARQTPFLI